MKKWRHWKIKWLKITKRVIDWGGARALLFLCSKSCLVGPFHAEQLWYSRNPKTWATCKLCDLGQAAYLLLASLFSSVNWDDKNTHCLGLFWSLVEILSIKMLCKRQDDICIRHQCLILCLAVIKWGEVYHCQFLPLQKKSLPKSGSERHMLRYTSTHLSDWRWWWLRHRAGTHDFPSLSKELAVWPWVSHWMFLGPSCLIHVAIETTE